MLGASAQEKQSDDENQYKYPRHFYKMFIFIQENRKVLILLQAKPVIYRAESEHAATFSNLVMMLVNFTASVLLGDINTRTVACKQSFHMPFKYKFTSQFICYRTARKCLMIIYP